MKNLRIFLLFSLFYVFCLYDNPSGITYPLFTAGFLMLFLYCQKQKGETVKKGSLFYMTAIFLLGLSNFLTVNEMIFFFNKCGIILLSGVLLLHNSCEDKSWRFEQYVTSLLKLGCLTFSNLFSFFSVWKDVRKEGQKVEEKQKKDGKIISVILGFLISILLLCVILPLLISADEIFSSLVERIVNTVFLNLVIPDRIFLLPLMFLWGTLFFFSLFFSISQKKVNPEIKDRRVQEPLTAITFLSVIGFIYFIFCIIQISYLFTGMKIPSGYTYSSFARQGFFQLLFVAVLNLILVLFCMGFFRKNKVLNVLLTFISGCTYIMIISSFFRMYLYIEAYQLTRLRVLVLAALLGIFIILGGVIRSIYRENFPLFRYSAAVVTVIYLCLSLSHMDYWIAKYNTALTGLNITWENQYITTLSADAAPVYVKALEEGTETTEIAKEMLRYYFDDCTEEVLKNTGFRKFNLSRHIAAKETKKYEDMRIR